MIGDECMTDEKKQAIILLGHGSRVTNAGQNMKQVASKLKEAYGFGSVEYCFMSRLGPHFPETLEKVAAQGETDILVIPYFLHSGLHIILDIPEMLQKEAARYQGVKVSLGGNLGFDDMLVGLVAKRVHEASTAPDVRDMELPSRNEFPVPPGQSEFVPMKPEEAKKYLNKHSHDHHH
jgi:sirohydrochlorin ferrochelatase